MKNKLPLFYLTFSLALLLFLIYPQISLAQQEASVRTGAMSTGLISANATGTVLGAGSAVIGGVGFTYGTETGVYTSTSSDFAGTQTTSSDFTIPLTGLSKGTLYYFRAYASTTVSTVYGDEMTFLTGVDAPSNLQLDSATDRIKISWTIGTGAEKTMVRYNDGTTYPALITDGTQIFWDNGANITLYNLPAGHTYYFSLWSSTSDGGITTTTRATIKATSGSASSSGGRSFSAPTTYADSLVINQGAGTTQTREVTLSLRASDASYMTIGNDNLFLGPLEDYTATKSWTLTEEDGVKTVYVKFVSSDGVNSGVVSDTITLDTSTPPPAPAPAPASTPTSTPEPTPTPTPTPVPTPTPTPTPVEKPVSEMTKEELTAKIAEILAQVKSLQTQLVEMEVGKTTGCAIASFDRNLKQGMFGNDVKCLQIILNSSADTKITAVGDGSPGNETTYFGPLTKVAVIKFQEKYASEVLASFGLAKGTGNVFTSTRAKLNELLGK